MEKDNQLVSLVSLELNGLQENLKKLKQDGCIPCISKIPNTFQTDNKIYKDFVIMEDSGCKFMNFERIKESKE